MASEKNLVDLVSQLKAIPTDPESYFQPTEEVPKDTLSSLKRVFDFSRQYDRSSGNGLCPLKELMVDGFDDEQIWQQIELQNGPVISDTQKKVRDVRKTGLKLRLVTSDLQNGHDERDNDDDEDDDDDRHFGVEFEDSDDDVALDSSKFDNRVMMPASSSEDEDDDKIMTQVSNNDEIDDGDEIDDDDEDSKNEDDNDEEGRKQGKKSKKEKKRGKSGSIVDDKFFKLSEMTEFLDKMDQDFERKQNAKQDDDDDEIDYFMDIESNDDDDDEGTDNEDDEEWGHVLGTTAKLMGRDIQKNKKVKTAAELKYKDYFDPPDGEGKQDKKNKKAHSEDDDVDMEDDIDDMDTDDMEGDDDDDDSSGNESKELMADKEEEEEDEKNNNKEILSQHEKNILKMEKKIAHLEKENLSMKPWQMSGEAGSKTRPLNSLLGEDLNFDHTTAIAPPITEETTKTLEEIIKQRIKDESWDDVERKQKPVTQPYEYKKKQPLDQEKSKLSLSQIYEQEYIKQTNVQEGPKEEEEIEGHKEIKELMTKLFTKLDALSNFHFTPKPLKPEVKIVTNTPVISMEEVAPVAASDAMLLAPEETHEKKVEIKGDTEKTDTDRKRERRSKKLKQKLKAKEQLKKKKLVNKLNPGLGNKYAKEKALKDLEKESKTSKNITVAKENAEEKTLKSSAFFARLQDEVKQQVHSKIGTSEKKKKKAQNSISKLKL